MTVLVQPSPVIRMQFFDANGDPLALGWVYTFIAGTNTPLATYTDHTGNVQNTNPIHLDSGGYADIWLTADSYKIRVEAEDHTPLYTIDGVPGIGSLISVGDLPPLFTTTFAAGALSFTLSNAAAGTLFGRFAGTTGAPSYGVIGSDEQVTFNKAGLMAGSDGLRFTDSTSSLRVRNANADGITLNVGTVGEPSINFGTSSAFPRIKSLQHQLKITSNAAESQDIYFGVNGDPELSVIIGGGTLVPIGTVRIGEGSHNGIIDLNDGNQVAGAFAGAKLICGFQADPNTVISAATGSLYVTVAGGANTTLWVKESSPTANTGWVAK